MPFIAFSGIDGSSEPMQTEMRYLDNLNASLRRNAIVAGMKSYLSTLRTAAMAAGPADYQKASGYRMAAHPTRSGEVVGYLYSQYPGNILEAGAAGHYAPLHDTVHPNGSISPGLLGYLQQHAPEVLEKCGRTARYIKVRPLPARPWVIPAADRVEGQAEEAFLQAVLDEIGKVS